MDLAKRQMASEVKGYTGTSAGAEAVVCDGVANLLPLAVHLQFVLPFLPGLAAPVLRFVDLVWFLHFAAVPPGFVRQVVGTAFVT